MNFNKEKFKEVLHYIICKCGDENNAEKGVLYKLLYFSDFNFFELYEKSLTGESYRKLVHGPSPVHFDLAIYELVNEEKVNVSTKNISLKRVMYTSLKEPTMNFNDNELFVINDVIDDLSYMNAKQISEYSHGDMPLRATEDRDIIDYGFVFYRNPKYVKRHYDESD